ncbi:MAG: sugar transferase, partial [Ignavibacteria bacterium GWB2_35_6b]
FQNVNIIERENNLGLANSVINGVTKIFNNYEKAIVLEDDLLFSKNFLLFMNGALNEFENVENVFSISGYNFPIDIHKDYKHQIYLSPRASSWGWATWRDRWLKTDWNVSDFNSFIKNENEIKEFNNGGNDLTKMLKNQVEGKIDSWAIRWSYAHFKNNAFCVYPVKSKVQNIGTDSSGLHSITTNKFYADLDSSSEACEINTKIKQDERILANFRKFFRFTLWERIYWRVKRNFKVRNS